MKTKKLLSLLLTLCMLLSVIPISAYAAANTPLSDGGSLNGSYYLSQDITLSKDITVKSGKTLDLYLNDYILNLNGYRIIVDGTLNLYDAVPDSETASTVRYFYDGNNDGCYESISAASVDGAIAVTGGVITGGDISAENETLGAAIYNKGTFNMYSGSIVGNRIYSAIDNSATGGGVYNEGIFVMNGGMISGNLVEGDTESDADNSGGGVFNQTDATFTMNNGTISYNKATGAGGNNNGSCLGFGGGVQSNGTFNMNGGAISNNVSDQNGGGICASLGTFNLTAGTISGNSSVWGGGLYVAGATANISGGAFSGNTSTVGGAISNRGTLTVSGGTYTDNAAYMGSIIYATKGFTLSGSVQLNSHTNEYGNTDNVYLAGNALITVNGFTGSCSVTKSGVTGVISTAAASTDTAYFVSDDSSYGVHLNSDGKLEISPYTVTVASDANGTVTADKATAKAGETITLSSEAATGYKLAEYSVTRNDNSAAVAVTNGTFTMPEADVTVSGVFAQRVAYTVSVSSVSNGTLEADVTSAEAGDTVTLTATPSAGYKLAGYTVTRNDTSAAVTVTDGTFIMPAANVTVSAAFTQNVARTITVETPDNGTITVSKTSAYAGEKITLTNTPGTSATFNKYVVYYVDDGKKVKIDVTDNAFVMPDYNVTVTALFDKSETNNPLKFTSDAPFTVIPSASNTSVLKNNIQYSTNGSNWTKITSLDTVVSAAQDSSGAYVLYFKGKYNKYETGGNAWTLTPTEGHTIAASGDVMSLFNYDKTLRTDALSHMFYNVTCLTSAPYISATSFGQGCCQYMFSGCISLTSVPNISATSFSQQCCYYMFSGCTSLTSAPNISATSFDQECCYSMFSDCTNLLTPPASLSAGEMAATSTGRQFGNMFANCTSLLEAPKLPATKLDCYCYIEMFANCTSLLKAPELPATTLAQSCYMSMFKGCSGLVSAPELPATTLADSCYNSMFEGCSGLVSAPELPATTLESNCYNSMFMRCSGLVSAPELPATTLAEQCYYAMFANCTSLTTVPELSATALKTNCYYQMFSYCTGITLYEQGSGDYFMIPSDAVDSGTSLAKMFISTGGTFTGGPTPGVKYYYSATGTDTPEVKEDTTDYLTFTSAASFTVTPNGSFTNLQYSTDKKTWTAVTSGTVVSSSSAAPYVLYFRGTGNTVITGGSQWILTATDGNTIAASGNIMTLLDYKNPDNAVMGESAFQFMFANCTALSSAPSLPATTLANYCYYGMFYECTSLTAAPELPATTLAASCYYEMFYGCLGLLSAPALPATTLAASCYYEMFYDCISLLTAPLLPATELVSGCYCEMFHGCYELKFTTEAPVNGGSYQIYYFVCDNTESTTFNMLAGTADGDLHYAYQSAPANTVIYLMTNDGDDNFTYNNADNIALTDATDTARALYTGSKLIVQAQDGSDYTVKEITAATVRTGELDITNEKQMDMEYNENAIVVVTMQYNSKADRQIETSTGITASDDRLKYYVDTLEQDLTTDTTFKLTVKEQEPETEKKTAIETVAEGKTVTFFDAKFTKTADSTTTEITDTGDYILSFTIPYDMTGLCELAVYRYHNSAEALTRVYTTANPQDGTYYVEGSGADTKITIFASKFSAYALGATKIPDDVKNATYSASLTLDADIDLNFTMGGLGTDGKGTDFVQSNLKITVDGTEWTGYTVENGVLIGTLASVAPQNIGKDLHIVITYDGVTVKDFDYSVKSYCEAVFKAQTADKALDTPTGKYDTLADLCEALLNYGKYAEDYANGNTDSTINAGHVITFGDNYTFTGVKDASTFLGDYAEEGSEAYLTLGSTIKLNFVLKSCTEDLSTGYDENGEADKDNPQNFFVLNDKKTPEQIDPKRVKVTTDGDDTIVSIDLYASQLSTSYTLKLKGVETSKFCITYGVYNYCSAAQGLSAEDGFTDTVKTLCKAIHNYSVAVDAYIESTK